MGGVLEQLLELEQVGEGSFVAPPGPEDAPRTYGGQFLAQALAAGQRSVDDDRHVHSLHAYFLGAGRVDRHLELDVAVVRDGRSFSVREVRAVQDGTELFRMLLSFHVPEPGLDHPPPAPPTVPPPDAVSLTYNEFNRSLSADPSQPWHGEARPIDVRYINPPAAAEGVPVTEAQLMWIRVSEPLPDDPRLHAAGLAYLADATLVDHVMLPHGYRWQDDRLTGASLDHAMWFHRPARADEWLLYDQRVVSTSGARGLASGTLRTAAGELVATCDQEGLMRWKAG